MALKTSPGESTISAQEAWEQAPAGVRKRRRFRPSPWLFLLPALLAFALFKYYPMFQGFYISLFDYSVVRPPGTFVGFSNFEAVLRDPATWRAIRNTLQLLAIGIALNFWGPILLAILVSEMRRFQTFFRLAYFLPSVAPGIAFIVLWKYVWQPDFGLANAVLRLLELPPKLWLNDPNLAKLAMKLPGLWVVGGLSFLIFLAALQSISDDLYEAAAIDGASFWQRVRHVTLPAIRPTTMTMFILAVIGGLQEFDAPYIMTQGGPMGTNVTISMQIYWSAFRDGRYGYAMALALLFFFFIGAVTIVQLRFQYRQE